MRYRVQLIPEEEGGFSVLVPGLPGCVSQGESREEALANVKEAIQLYLEEAMAIASEGESAVVVLDLDVA
jgi:predicted RNase H-like HicB family nuclease